MNSKLGLEARRYLAVGAGGYIVDVGLFNVLSILGPANSLEFGQLVHKGVATSVAIAFTYLLNSRWTFSHRQGRPEGVSRVSRYLLVNIVGLSIGVGCLYISRYVLGFDSLLADNISANIIGVGLALVFRFLANRKWVFVA